MSIHTGSHYAVVLQSVSASYGSTAVLDNLTLRVRKGERIVISGPNGSGKSTLLKLISGTMKPTDGSIDVLGLRLDNQLDRQRIRQQIGFLTQIQQDPEIAVSVCESVLLGLWGTRFSWGKRPAKADRDKAIDRLELVGLGELAHRDIRTLSGGQRQRVALARALIRDPALVLMDEPTTYLESAAKEDLVNRIAELHRQLGFTSIIVSHEPLSSLLSDRRIHLESGTAQEYGEVQP